MATNNQLQALADHSKQLLNNLTDMSDADKERLEYSK